MKQFKFIILLIILTTCKAKVEVVETSTEPVVNKVEGFRRITSWEWYVEYKDGSRIGGRVSVNTTSSKSAMDHAFDLSEPHARDTSRVKKYIVRPIYNNY